MAGIVVLVNRPWRPSILSIGSLRLKKSVEQHGQTRPGRKWYAEKLKESIGKGTTKSGETVAERTFKMTSFVPVVSCDIIWHFWRDPKRDLAVDQQNMRAASWPCILPYIHPCNKSCATRHTLEKVNEDALPL